MIPQANRMETEMAVLFGPETLIRARRTDVEDLDFDAAFMDSISETAGQLLAAKGLPWEQQELVNSLDQKKRLLLCMWLIDTDLIS